MFKWGIVLILVASTAFAAEKTADQEMAQLLVKLEKRTRAVMLEHFTRPQADESATSQYKSTLIKNKILPAAVADPIFYETVQKTTDNRAWVKMVVESPRNPNNQGDAVALDLFHQLKNKTPSAERKTADAYYYAEPIVASAGCMVCHGDPAGARDPHFNQYKKEGWKENEVVGAIVAKVKKK